MLMSRDQIEKLYKVLQEKDNVEANLLFIKDVANGSGIGPDTFAYIYKRKNAFQEPTLVAEVNITDTDLW